MAEGNTKDPELKWLGWWGRFKYREWIKDCRESKNVSKLIYDLQYMNSREDLYKYFRIALDLGADPNYRQDNRTLTGYAAWNDDWYGHKSIVMLLLERGGNADEALRELVTRYCDEDALELARAILEFGGDPNAPDRKGLTPLMLAAGNGDDDHPGYDGYTKMVSLLLEHGGDLSIKEPEYGTALGHAAFSGDRSLETVRLLLENGADPAAAGKEGEFPLMLAARSRSKETVKLLIENGADPNQQNMNGTSALMEAAEQAHEDEDDEREGALAVIRVLVERGAKIDLGDENDDTAYDYAKKWDNETAMSLLK